MKEYIDNTDIELKKGAKIAIVYESCEAEHVIEIKMITATTANILQAIKVTDVDEHEFVFPLVLRGRYSSERYNPEENVIDLRIDSIEIESLKRGNNVKIKIINNKFFTRHS